MRYLLLPALCCLLCCQGNKPGQQLPEINQQTNSDTGGIQLVDTNSTPRNPEDELLIADPDFETILGNFPKKWVNIELKGNDLIYTQRCDLGDPHLYLEFIDGVWQIETFYGKDGERWQLINITSRENNVGGQILQEGIMVVQKITYPDDQIYEVSYFWNKTARFATFGDFFSKDIKFAQEEFRAEFIVKKEKCN